jgi:adenosylcobyric acid synthase
MSERALVLMVQGTASSVGKSTLVAGLCRLLAQRGIRVAPFKAQNMSNNGAVCADGGEIGRAQFAQAVAAGIEPTVNMNPILLKPQPGGSQLIVRGQFHGRRTSSDYFRGEGRRDLWPVVTESLDRLRAEFDLIIAEGAGSPAEINLRASDLVNMEVALYAQADVVLVADIDRGGAFASLLGTWEWLALDERALVKGFVLNKFRGDPKLLAHAPMLLMQRTAVPVIGVVPYVQDLLLPEEDAASLSEVRPGIEWLDIAVIRLPHLANFDEFGPLATEPGVHLRWITQPHELRAPDLVILPGSKATIPDLLWLHERGLSDRIRWLASHCTPVLGICGGYQMLGLAIADPNHVESQHATATGLQLLPIQTDLRGTKRLARVHGRGHPNLPRVWAALSGVPVAGYEIHMGRTRTIEPGLTPLFDLDGAQDGSVSRDGQTAGTYLHGILEQPALRAALLTKLAQMRGFAWAPSSTPPVDAYDRLAAVLADNLDLTNTCVASLCGTRQSGA